MSVVTSSNGHMKSDHRVAVVYSFVGPFPAAYAVDSVKQTRQFHPFPRPIYFIVSDLHHPCVRSLEQEEGVVFIDYAVIRPRDFEEVAYTHRSKFISCPSLGDRSLLFMRAYERYFLLYRAWLYLSSSSVQSSSIRSSSVTHADGILFMECDNLLYADPREWFSCMDDKPIAYMYDNESRCGAGIFLLRLLSSSSSSWSVIPPVFLEWLNYLLEYIRDPSHEMVHEMKTLHDFWKQRPNQVQMLPTHWPDERVPLVTYESFESMGCRVFDVAGIGILLGGLDPVHTEGIVRTGDRAPWSAIDYRPYRYEWRRDEYGRRTLWIYPRDDQEEAKRDDDEKGYAVQNLHVHSKVLTPFLSSSF